MLESTPTRQRLVTAMADLMRHQGYGATTIKQVSDLAQATTGSLYHFFPRGKSEVAAAALRSAGAAYIALVPALLEPYDDLADGLGAFFAAAAEDVERAGWVNMCPVATVAAEIADTETELWEVTQAIVSSWIEEATQYLTRWGLSQPAARQLTVTALTALEGGFLMARVLHSSEPLHAAGRAIVSAANDLSSTVRR